MEFVMQRVVLGVDIGGTKVAAYIDDGTATGQAYQTHATPAESQPHVLQGVDRTSGDYYRILQNGRFALLQVVVDLCFELFATAQANNLEVAAIGIGTAGQVDMQTGTVVDANENLVGWKDTSIATYVGQTLGFPVFVDNDVRVMALAECTVGAGRGYPHVLCMTVGTGIGGALVINHQLWDGAHRSAGEIGYFYVTPDETIEDRYSGPGLVRHHLEKHPAEPDLTLRDIAQRAAQGDRACIETLQQGAHDLALVLAPVIAFLDPAAVIVGGGVVEIGALWWLPFVETLQSFRLKHIRQIDIVQAQLGNRAGMIGAALLARQKVGL
jgi:glucokinase